MLKNVVQQAIGCIFMVACVFLFGTHSYIWAALGNVTDTISHSRAGLPAEHTVAFTTSQDIGANGYFELTLDEEFGAIGYAACAGPNADISTTSDTVRCTYSSSPGAATSSRILLYNTPNPSDPGRYNVWLSTYDAGDNLLEEGNAAVYIMEDKEISAYVGAVMTFSMDQEDVSEVNGIPVTGSSTAVALPFGTLQAGASSTLAQTLSMRTNASNGFSCTVQQDQELTSEGNHTINSFNNSPDGSGSTTPQYWSSPAAVYSQDNTFGHLGVTTDDPDLSTLDFTGGKYAGLNGTEPLEIFYHNGPVADSAVGSGVVHVAYTLEVSAIQEEGNYTNNLTYICTGNF